MTARVNAWQWELPQRLEFSRSYHAPKMGRAFVFNQWKPSLGDDLVQNLRMALKSRGRVDLKKGVNNER